VLKGDVNLPTNQAKRWAGKNILGFSLRVGLPAANPAAVRHYPHATDRLSVFPCLEFFCSQLAAKTLQAWVMALTCSFHKLSTSDRIWCYQM